MTELEIRDQVARLNALLQSKPWLDVDVVECSPRSVVLDCGIDLSVGPDIEITFGSVFFVSLPMTWNTDTSVPVLTLLSDDEARQVNLRYQIEMVHHLFAFHPEYLPQDALCLVAAKEITWRELRSQ
jgi:hypothetical protein